MSGLQSVAGTKIAPHQVDTKSGHQSAEGTRSGPQSAEGIRSGHQSAEGTKMRMLTRPESIPSTMSRGQEAGTKSNQPAAATRSGPPSAAVVTRKGPKAAAA